MEIVEMDVCSIICDKIIYYDKLDLIEKQRIKEHANNCQSCQKYLQEIGMIMSSLNRNMNQHSVDDELLLRYSIHISIPNEPDYDGRNLTNSEIADVRQHVAVCESCQKKVNQYCQDFKEIDEYWETKKLPSITINPKLSVKSTHSRIAKFLRNNNRRTFGLKPRYIPFTIGAAALLVILWLGPFFRGNQALFDELISFDEVSLLTRNNISPPLNEAISAYYTTDYERAIQELEGYISSNPSNPQLYYAHFILGISYLNEARSDILGRFQKFNVLLVENGIYYLERANALSANPSIEEDCLWYITKAYLMINQEEKAKKTLESIINFEGRRYQQAKQFLIKIDNL